MYWRSICVFSGRFMCLLLLLLCLVVGVVCRVCVVVCDDGVEE